MYELNDFDIKELKAKKLLASDGHPSTEAFRQVFSSPSADLDKLAIDIETHGRDCPVCGKRYKEASYEIVKLQKTTLNPM
jgi:hypothetical protein